MQNWMFHISSPYEETIAVRINGKTMVQWWMNDQVNFTKEEVEPEETPPLIWLAVSSSCCSLGGTDMDDDDVSVVEYSISGLHVGLQFASILITLQLLSKQIAHFQLNSKFSLCVGLYLIYGNKRGENEQQPVQVAWPTSPSGILTFILTRSVHPAVGWNGRGHTTRSPFDEISLPHSPRRRTASAQILPECVTILLAHSLWYI